MWGSQRLSELGYIGGGSIPTCVGQPRFQIHPDCQRAVYPHVCGAAPVAYVTKSGQKGLSPRVWGSPIGTDQTLINQGSIPTCVGQPAILQYTAVCTQVYPHVCGAAPWWGRSTFFCEGLSPRVWGSRYGHSIGPSQQGSIPTCVGQPNKKLSISSVDKVYPHVCGAASPGWVSIDHQVGLSPRVWGSHSQFCRRNGTSRSIPTCVGQPGRK